MEERVRHEHSNLSEEELKTRIRWAQEDEVGDIPVPPKYADKDFANDTY